MTGLLQQVLTLPLSNVNLGSCDMGTYMDSAFWASLPSRTFGTILADPPWQFANRTGKIAPEHRRLSRYSTMTLDDIKALPVPQFINATAHLYLWVPNALLPDGLAVMA